VTADYRILAYFRDEKGVFVNLYLPSTLRWISGDGAQMKLAQSGDYPFDGRISMLVSASRPSAFALRLRIPAWATVQIRVNGEAAAVEMEKGFARLERSWKDGDRIELGLSMPMRLEAIDARHPNTLALVRGPLVLFAIGESAKAARQELMTAARVPGQKAWKAGDLLLRPFSEIRDESYNTYLQVG
jgi:hypothetical protein